MNNHVTILQIDGHAIKHNLFYFKQKVRSKTKILVVVKAFGYGTDALEIAKLIANEVDYFAVAYTDEGVSLRKANITTPILVFHPQIQNLERLVKYRLEPNLYNFKILKHFLKLADQTPLMHYPIHIKFNTGLNRVGFLHTDIPAIVSIVKSSNNIKIQSIFSHLAASEDLEEREFTKNQIHNFQCIVQQMYKYLNYQPIIHILNTSGIINYPEAQFDMVRLGIGLFGFGETDVKHSKLKNVLTLKSVISQIHCINPGETVGYNRAFVAKIPTKIATIAIGHADGIFRKFANNGYVIIHNKKAPIIGNVCMDMMMVDVTNIECNQADQVIIFNSQDMIEQMAKNCETISYEIIAAISQRVKRVIKY